MSRITIITGVGGMIGLTSAATCWIFALTNNTSVETSREEQRNRREKFFKPPEKKPLVGQEMRPRW